MLIPGPEGFCYQWLGGGSGPVEIALFDRSERENFPCYISRSCKTGCGKGVTGNAP
ncbi:MAG: hypothetical protein ACLR6B_16305 [Blautia sp.]